MKKALLIVTLAAACGGSASFSKDEARNALPDKDSVAMNTPQGSSGSSLKTGLSAASVSNDFYFNTTVTVAATFNLPVAVFLNLVATVTANEPTSCTPTSCTWGPGSSALDFNNYQIVVSLNADGSYHWALSGQAKSKPGSAFVEVASGDATPSGTPHHGSGSFVMNFDSAATLDGPHDATTGTLNVTHYTNVGPAQLTVSYTGATDSSSGDKENIAYAYAEDSAGGGKLQFAVHNLTSPQQISVESRWKNDGSGRADLKGDVASGLTVSDCWGAAPFTKLFFTSNIAVGSYPFAGSAFGAESSCAFSAAEFSTLTIP